MQRVLARLSCALVCAALALPVHALTVRAAISEDGSWSSLYRAGDKPSSPCTPFTGWTEGDLGDGGGEYCEQSATAVAGSASGTHQLTDAHILHKDAGDIDVQFVARITDSYAGATHSFASYGIQLRDGITDTGYVISCQSLQAGATAIQAQYGSNGAYTTVNGSPGQSRPRYCGITRHADTGDVKVWASDDGTTWNIVAESNHALADAKCVIAAASKSTNETLQGTVDNIDCGSTIDIYSPDEPPPPDPPNEAPVCAAVANQSGTQGVAFSLSLAGICTDANGDTLAYSAVGSGACATLSACGLAINASSGAVTGTPNATARTASPFTITVTATDPLGALDTTAFSLQVAPATGSGTTFTIATGATAIFDCNAQGVDPGDTVKLAGGVHNTTRTIRNCFGTATAPIKIINDTAAAQPATIRVPGNRPRAGLMLENVDHVYLDGDNGWSGQPAGECGLDDDGVTHHTNGCGIRVDGETNGGAQSMMLLQGRTTNITLEGFELYADYTGGLGTTATATTGLSVKENDRCKSDHPGEWRENFLIRKFIIRNTRAALTYFGVNLSVACGGVMGDSLDNRNWIVEYGLLHTSGSNGFHAKRFPGTDPNTLIGRYLHIWDIGGSSAVASDGAVNRAYDCYEASCTGHHLTISDTNPDTPDGPGVTCSLKHRPPSQGKQFCYFYNIEIADVQGHGINAVRDPTGVFGDSALMDIKAEYITVVNPGIGGGACANTATAQTGSIRNIICAAPTAARQAINTPAGILQSGNLKGTVADMDFVNSGAGNYKLLSTSPAVNSAGGACPSDDLTGILRPQGGSCDRGAHERQ